MWRRQNTSWIKMKWYLWEAAHVPNVYHSYIKRLCKKTGVCEPVTGNVEGTELPGECYDESVGEDKVEIALKEFLDDEFGRPARNREQDGKEAREGVENGNQGFGCAREDKETQTSSVSNDVDKLLVIQFGIVICRTWSYYFHEKLCTSILSQFHHVSLLQSSLYSFHYLVGLSPELHLWSKCAIFI